GSHLEKVIPTESGRNSKLSTTTRTGGPHRWVTSASSVASRLVAIISGPDQLLVIRIIAVRRATIPIAPGWVGGSGAPLRPSRCPQEHIQRNACCCSCCSKIKVPEVSIGRWHPTPEIVQHLPNLLIVPWSPVSHLSIKPKEAGSRHDEPPRALGCTNIVDNACYVWMSGHLWALAFPPACVD